MKRRVNLMCSLALVASLASCAPAFQKPPDKFYTPKTQVGISSLFAQKVKIAELTDQTPDAAYVEFPNCSLAVIQVKDVRLLGPQKASELCRKSSDAAAWSYAFQVVSGVVSYFFMKYLAKLFLGPLIGY